MCVSSVHEEEENGEDNILYNARAETHFVSFRNSQIELRSPTVRRPNKNPRRARARGLLRATKQSAFFVAKTFLSFPFFSLAPRNLPIYIYVSAKRHDDDRHIYLYIIHMLCYVCYCEENWLPSAFDEK